MDEQITELGPHSRGRFLMRSASGTTHEIDIADGGTILWVRRPARGRLPGWADNHVIRVTKIVEWPAVGLRGLFAYVDSPDPGADHWQSTTPPVSIEQVADPDPWNG